MKITKEELQELGACEPGVDWFIENFPNGTTINELLDRIREKKAPWMALVFRNFKLSGVCESWYDNGMWFRANYVNGKLEGVCEGWYENGQLWCRSNYVNGKLEGVCEWWNENGQLRYREYYVNGVKV